MCEGKGWSGRVSGGRGYTCKWEGVGGGQNGLKGGMHAEAVGRCELL